MQKHRKMIAGFVLPALIIFIVIYVYPTFRTLLMSFFKIEAITDDFMHWQFVAFENYSTLFRTPLFVASMWNIFKIWVLGGSVVMGLSLLFASILCTEGFLGKKFFRAVIYLPNIVSAVALATMWLQYVFSPSFGLFKAIGQTFHWKWLANFNWLHPDHKFLALLIAYCFGMVGYHMLIWISGIDRIDSGYFEAATIDGASKPKQFFHITLPLLKGVARTNLTMWSITTVGFFIWSQLFSTVTADTSTITPMYYMYIQLFGSGNSVTERNAGRAAAIGVLLSVCVLIVFTILNRSLRDDDLEF